MEFPEDPLPPIVRRLPPVPLVGRAKQQAQLPGRNPASLAHVNNSPFMSLSNTKVISPEQHGSFLKCL
jgi:hypothetical protein